jgi:hypothetical protein
MIGIKNKSGKVIHTVDADSLIGADLSGAKLTDAKLTVADLTDADLTNANLINANLISTDLTRVNLFCANLTGADLTNANLSDANLTNTNLSNTKGLLDQKDWLFKNFKETKDGLIVYKAIGKTHFEIPSYWKIEIDSYLEEKVNYNRTSNCGCGVNFGTLEYVERQFPNSDIWKCLIEWKDMMNVVVPYNTDGKARCARLKLVERIK